MSSDANVVRIFDTTLRDGEQAPGIALTRPEKVEIALRSARRAIMMRRRVAAADFFSAFVCMPHKLRMLLRHGLPRMS